MVKYYKKMESGKSGFESWLLHFPLESFSFYAFYIPFVKYHIEVNVIIKQNNPHKVLSTPNKYLLLPLS